ncbi:LysR family transcriptional regulator, partial [Salmonella enterica subsp. enterica serovar Enteritidis str. 436]
SAPAELSHWPGLSLASGKHIHRWELYGPQGARAEVHFTPRMITTDMLALREAAMAGVGLVQLPVLMVKEQLAAGELVAVLEEWEPRRGGYSCCVPIPARAITFRTCVGRFFDGRVCADGGRVTCSSFIDLMDAKKAG